MRWRVWDGTWRSGSHPARALILLASIVALLIVGLLGMHAMGGVGSDHGASGVGHSGVAMPALASHASHDPAELHRHQAASLVGAPAPAASSAEHCDGDCQGVAPLSPGHAELMACVLALLVGLLVLVPPGRVGSSRMPSLRLPAPLIASAVRLEAPRPSLTVLSISRT